MAKKGDMTFVDLGNLLEGDPDYGVLVNCYVCGAQHNAFGLACIRDQLGTTDVSLCEPCLKAKPTDAILRKFKNAPDMQIGEKLFVTTEQYAALSEKQNKTEH